MIILGIDPGSLCTGYGVVRVAGSRISYVEGGVLRPSRGLDLSARLTKLHDGLAEIIRRTQPDAAALEECFMGRYARAALVLGHARGALIVAAATARVPVHEYAPRLVKLAATGTGGASKEQIMAMIPRIVAGAPAKPGSDEADALAVAVCHAHRGPCLGRSAIDGQEICQ